MKLWITALWDYLFSALDKDDDDNDDDDNNDDDAAALHLICYL